MKRKLQWQFGAWPLRLASSSSPDAAKKKSSRCYSRASAPAAAPATPIDPATAASISGTVKFEGEAPKAAKIDMSQDPACKGTNVAENVMAAGGHLGNVFVYVKEGLGNRTFMFPKKPSSSIRAAANTIPTCWRGRQSDHQDRQ